MRGSFSPTNQNSIPYLTPSFSTMDMDHLPVFIITSLLVILLALITWKKSKFNFRTTPNLPPGPMRLPLIGNMHLLLGSLPHRRLADMAKRYGPIMSLQLGQVPHVIVSSPEMAKQVMKTHDVIFASRPYMLAASVLAYNAVDIAFAPYGESWRQLRKISVLELLSAKSVQSFRSIREEEVAFLVESIASIAGSPVELTKMLAHYSYTIIARTAFHQPPNQQDSFGPLVQRIIEALEGFSVADFFPSVRLLHVISGMMVKLKALHQETDSLLQGIINEHIERRATSKVDSDSEENDLVGVLLSLKESGELDFSLSMENIKAVLLDIFLAGNESSATVIEWAMAELHKNPRAMKRAQAEVREIYGKKGKVDETRFRELNYLQLVIKETLRLHPPAPLLVPREARETVEINGYLVPMKTKVLVNAWAIGRDPEYWTEPEIFNPERFLNSSIDYKETDFGYIPFGAGRRMCPGMLYGKVVVELALANLLYHFDWKLPGEMKPEDLDMDEAFGLTTRRKHNLCAIPTPYLSADHRNGYIDQGV